MHPLEAMGWRIDVALLLLAERAILMDQARERAEAEARQQQGGGGGAVGGGGRRYVSFGRFEEIDGFLKGR